MGLDVEITPDPAGQWVYRGDSRNQTGYLIAQQLKGCNGMTIGRTDGTVGPRRRPNGRYDSRSVHDDPTGRGKRRLPGSLRVATWIGSWRWRWLAAGNSSDEGATGSPTGVTTPLAEVICPSSAQVSAILGQQESGPVVSTTPHLVMGSSTGTGKLRSYRGTGSQMAAIQVASSTASDFASEKSALLTTGVSMQPVSGVGQAAFVADGVELFVLKDNVFVSVGAHGSSIAQLEALAAATRT
jgi:hypothetical protein